jgi:mannose-6-phosphate isomerase-like protein (cupin superfamily)
MLQLEDYKQVADQCNEPYFNTVINSLNDHVVRMGIMTAPYPWHLHPDSDETFIGVEGSVIIETPEGIFELTPGTSITIPANLAHRTRPKGTRSVNLTVEKAGMHTIFING